MRIVLILILLPIIYSLENGLARTPQMGWNSWNKFACGINENLIKGVADAMVSSGLAAAGYQYLNLDDCWQKSRDINNVIQADPQAFPSGIKALADYVHAKGLKFGLYSDAGAKTCQGRPGGLYFENVDAKTYAEWGVDYLKYDNCYNLNLPAQFRYPRMRDALNQTGRPILFSICEWGQSQPWTWAGSVGNSWRTTGDIEDDWSSLLNIIEKSASISGLGAPGAWNDPDMLEIGNGGMTTIEYETHFTFWAFMKAPLIVGCDVRNMSEDTKRILTNTELIAVNQDPLGKPATRFVKAGNLQIWGGPIKNDEYVVLLFNAGEKTELITASFSMFGLTGSRRVWDMWKHEGYGIYEKEFTGKVERHGVMALRLYKVSDETPSGGLRPEKIQN